MPVLINRKNFPIMYRVLTLCELFLNGRLLRYGQFNKVAQDETKKLPKNSETQQDAGKEIIMYTGMNLEVYAKDKMERFLQEAENERLIAAVKKGAQKEIKQKDAPSLGVVIQSVLQMFNFGGDLASANKSS